MTRITHAEPGTANVLWFLPTLSRPLPRHVAWRARGTPCAISPRSRKPPTNSAILARCCQRVDPREDSWVVASALAPLTRRLRFLVAVRPGLQSPTVAARMTATLDRISDGRLLINVVTGGDPVENRGDGIFLDHDERYVVTDEFLQIYTRLLAGETVSFKGEHLQVEDGELMFLPVQPGGPPLYSAALRRPARRSPPGSSRNISPGANRRRRLRKRSPNRARVCRVRPHLELRDPPACHRSRKARRGVGRGRQMSPACRRRDHRRRAEILQRMDFVRQQQCPRHQGAATGYEISPNLRAGVAARGGAGTALGAMPIEWRRGTRYIDAGFEHLDPVRDRHLEEAYRVADLVLPRFRCCDNARAAATPAVSRPFRRNRRQHLRAENRRAGAS